jgi:hydroxyacylglutathione hydrolase
MLQITPLKAFKDNYIWMLQSQDSSQAVAIDPGDETPVLAWLQKTSSVLSAILITHHHYDHVGGIPELCWAFPGIPVFGPEKDRILGVTHRLKEGDYLEIPGLACSWQVLHLPGHTAGHIAYYGEGLLFCGDTLFAAGCGRVFSGTAEQLSHSLQRIAQLPLETLIYCAHEYTLDNLGFARWVEPDNGFVSERTAQVRARCERDLPCVPTRLALELQTNPFLRLHTPLVVAAAEKRAGHSLHGADEVFSVLRNWKDREYD